MVRSCALFASTAISEGQRPSDSLLLYLEFCRGYSSARVHPVTQKSLPYLVMQPEAQPDLQTTSGCSSIGKEVLCAVHKARYNESTQAHCPSCGQ